MSRKELVSQLDRPATEPWDVAVIGGGAVGVGVALDAVSRGYSCVLFEQHDFAKGTSSRSTKLIHGGVRYLAQGNISLVREALHERGLLMRNAPDMVQPLRFIVPCYSMPERWYYWAGMKCYDAMAGRLGIKNSHQVKTKELLAAVPGLRKGGLNGGVAYYDAQFDDARLVITVARKVKQLGGVPLNYFCVEDLLKANQKIVGVKVRDQETDQTYEVRAKAVVNAGGVFSDAVRRLESSSAPQMISPSQGIHLVVNKRFLGGDDAIMIPKTKDGRVLFAIPWLGRAVLGTTDTPLTNASLEPKPLKEEVDYLLEHFAEYLDPAPKKEDVLSCYAGLRPLVKPKQEAGSTSKISREHRVIRSSGDLISILGGKWTTFRKMAEDVMETVIEVAQLPASASKTEHLQLDASIFGSAAADPDRVPSDKEIQFSVDEEFARTLEDVLARRYRCLFLDAHASIRSSEIVAQAMAKALGHSEVWAAAQVAEYVNVAESYALK